MKRFLISRLSALGDVVCSLPAAGALKAAFPDSQITWVVDPRFRAIVERCRYVDVVVPFKPSLRPSDWPRFETSFDAALDLQGLLKSAIPVARAKAAQKLSHHWRREGAGFFSHPVLPDPSSLHIVDQNVDVARAAGGQAYRAEFGLAPSPEDVDRSMSLLSDRGIGGKFAVMNPGGAWASKRWPASSFAEVAGALASKGIPSVLIGAKSESELDAAKEILSLCPGGSVVSLVGETGLGDLIGLISLASAHLGGDTGSTHIAAALGVPAIGLYSATRPERTGPYGQRARCLFQPEGLKAIESADVAKLVLEALN